MKPTWIVLLLVSLALLHAGQSNENSEGNDFRNNGIPKEVAQNNSTEGGSQDNAKVDDGPQNAAETISNVSPDASKNETSTTVTPPAATKNSSADGSSVTKTPSEANSNATVNPMNGSATDNSSKIHKTLEGDTEMAVNTSNQMTATPKLEQPNDENKDGKNSSKSKEEGPKSPPSGPTASTQGPSETIPVKETNVEDQLKAAETDRRILWILLPVLGVLVAGVLFVLKFKCMKVSDHAEPTENGTENASFQRSDSNKDNVMLVGVKTSGGEENVAAR